MQRKEQYALFPHDLDSSNVILFPRSCWWRSGTVEVGGKGFGLLVLSYAYKINPDFAIVRYLFCIVVQAGIGICLSGHPFDTIKVLLQTQPAENPRYSGMVDAARKTMAKEGVRGLYAGVTSPLVGMTIFNAVQFLSYSMYKDLFTEHGRVDTLSRIGMAGVATGVTVALVEGPQDLLKCQMQRQVQLVEAGGKAEYSSVGDAARKLFSRHGAGFLLQGLPATMARNAVGVSAYFGFYEAGKRFFTKGEKRPASGAEVLASGALGGIMYWVLCQPLDVIKSQIQSDVADPARRSFRGFFHCASSIAAKEGVAGFLRGFTPSLARSVPANAIGFFLHEQTKAYLTKK